MNYLFLPGFGRIPIDIMDILRRIWNGASMATFKARISYKQLLYIFGSHSNNMCKLFWILCQSVPFFSTPLTPTPQLCALLLRPLHLLSIKRACPRKIEEQKKNPHLPHFGKELFRGNFLTEFIWLNLICTSHLYLKKEREREKERVKSDQEERVEKERERRERQREREKERENEE